MSVRHLIAFAVPASMVGTPALAAGIEVDFDPDAGFAECRTLRLVALSDAPASATGVISSPGAREDADRWLARELACRACLPVKIDDPVDTREHFVRQIEKGLAKCPPSGSEIRHRGAEHEKSPPQKQGSRYPAQRLGERRDGRGVG